MSKLFRALILWLSAIGVNPIQLVKASGGILGFLRERRSFWRSIDREAWELNTYPILTDRFENSSSMGEYFWQDTYVARRVLALPIAKHIDVGSRVDGFIAQIALNREVEVLDIRPMPIKMNNVVFTRWDITDIERDLGHSADLVTCLHTIEHIGLGRYGDSLNVDGWKVALRGLRNLLSPAGLLFLSTPIGQQRVEFNAHRVFHPRSILDEARNVGLTLEEILVLGPDGVFKEVATDSELSQLALERYSLGLFVFRAPSRPPGTPMSD